MRLRLAVDIASWNPTDSEFDFLLRLLPAEDAEDCKKFRFKDDQKRSVISRLLQRFAAHKALGIPQAEVVIKRTKGRKPYVANDVAKDQAPNFNYSVSHEGNYVILSAEPLCITGCDVAAPQQLRRKQDQKLLDVLSAFRQQLSVAEWQTILACSPNEPAMESTFQQFWSLKESFVKATGEGLGFDLGKAQFSINNSTASVQLHGASPDPHWTFHLHQLGNGHWASVARASPDVVVDAWGGFKATFNKPVLSREELESELKAVEPPFTMLTVCNLVPEGLLSEYEAAGGDVML